MKKKICLILLFSFFCSYSQKNNDSIDKIIKFKIKQSSASFSKFQFDESEKFLNEAKQIAINSNNKVYITYVNIHYAIYYRNLREFSLSKKQLKICLDDAMTLKNDSLISRTYNILAILNFYSKQSPAVTLDYYKKSLYFIKKTNNYNRLNIGYFNLGIFYSDNKKYDYAIKYLDSCNEYVNKYEDENFIVDYYSLKGFCNLNLKNDELAFKDLHYSLKIAKHNEILPEPLSDLYKYLSEYYENKNIDSSYYYLQKSYSIYRKHKKNFEDNLNHRIETQQRIQKLENENILQKDNLKIKNITLFLLFLVVLTIVWLYYISNKNNQFKNIINKQLQDKNDELLIAKNNAEQANNLKTQFISTISHELRTPLYGVVGITNLLLENNSDNDKKSNLNLLKFSSNYLLSLVNDLLQMNNFNVEKITLFEEDFSLNEILRTVKNSLEFISINNRNVILLKIDSKIPDLINGDSNKLFQILVNLVSNSLKFTKNGTVEICADLEKIDDKKATILFKVKDTGIGISEENHALIFEKFVQINRQNSDYQGTGLGLSIVKKLISAFKSDIVLESELGKGSCFMFKINFLLSENKLPLSKSKSEENLSNYKILVVEDNKINQIITKKNFRKNLIMIVSFQITDILQ